MKRSIPPATRHRIEESLLIAARRGLTHGQAARIGGIHRATLYRWLAADPDFAARYARAREHGSARRDYLRWLRHPFRGYRPPTGKRTRPFPRYGMPSK